VVGVVGLVVAVLGLGDHWRLQFCARVVGLVQASQLPVSVALRLMQDGFGLASLGLVGVCRFLLDNLLGVALLESHF
ncbi:hypothetical protein, partial [Pseudomonas syringae group genomosp. 7]|uniref:hypothetical protein n=1 Tax=Pseudomonas syringae group genomosp. 7 TaxID=251699 RepID=UPI00376FEB83